MLLSGRIHNEVFTIKYIGELKILVFQMLKRVIFKISTGDLKFYIKICIFTPYVIQNKQTTDSILHVLHIRATMTKECRQRNIPRLSLSGCVLVYSSGRYILLCGYSYLRVWRYILLCVYSYLSIFVPQGVEIYFTLRVLVPQGVGGMFCSAYTFTLEVRKYILLCV